MTEETCLNNIDLAEETLSNLVHLADEGYEGAQQELDKRIKSLPE